MGIKKRVAKAKAWLKEKFKRKKRLRQRLEMVEEAMTDLIKHGLQQDGFDRESRVKMIATLKSHMEEVAQKLIEKEKKNRIANIKLAEKRAIEKSISEVQEALARMKEGEELILKTHKRTITREENLDGLMSLMRKKVTEFDQYINKIKVLEGLADSAKDAYDMYLDDLKAEINDAKETHAIPRRMASLEARITQLEIGHNGSGKTTSGTIGAYQD